MKYTLIIVLFLLIISGCAVLAAGRGVINRTDDGLFEGTGQGYRGPVRVQVRLNEGNITEIIVIDSSEDRFVGKTAIEELIDLVIAYNTTDIDAISGATESSRGFLEAVENAIFIK